MRSYASIYGCGGDAPVHVCHSCPEGRVREFARTRSGGFIRDSYLPALIVDPTDITLWQAGIDAGNIIILPETSGSYDPGDPKELKGFGDRRVNYGPRTMKLVLNDPDYKDNYPFYNEISDRTDLVPFFRTSGLVHIFDKVAAIKAKDPVVDDLEEEVIWQVDCEVISKNLPSIHPATTIMDIFSCASF